MSDVITASLNARFTEFDPKSEKWPCPYPSAQSLKLRVASGAGAGTGAGGGAGGTGFRGPRAGSHSVVANAKLAPSAIQDLGDIIPQILEIKNKANVPLVIRVQIEIDDKDNPPDDETVRALNQLLGNIDVNFRFEK